MRKTHFELALWLAGTIFMAMGTPCHAQSSRWIDAVKSVAAQTIDDGIRGQVDATHPGSGAGAGQASPLRKLSIHETYDFVPGDGVLFRDNFTNVPAGSMPATWATNGSGRVVSLNGITGKWLELQPGALYKPTKSGRLPSDFTLEFDIVAVTDRAANISVFTFGFARDGSVAGNDALAVNEVSLQYQNGNGGTVHSYATDVSSAFEFDLSGYVSRPMHVSIAVDGDKMRVYLDRTKIADARLFNTDSERHFYMVGPIDPAGNGARLVAGNFEMNARR